MPLSTAADAQRPLRAGERVRLAGEVLLVYVAARRALGSRPLPAAVERLRERRMGSPLAAPEHHTRIGRRLARAAERTLAPLPSDTRCLTQSLVLTALLARRGIQGTLVIGVRTGPSFGAHAWVERDGAALLPPIEHEYERLTEV